VKGGISIALEEITLGRGPTRKKLGKKKAELSLCHHLEETKEN